MDTGMDYAELWLDAQKAHKAIFEAALAKDWLLAIAHAEALRHYSSSLSQWFRDADLSEKFK